ncbi:MAG: VWA domain-containing protein [Gammaproteobacteria bacterium]|nr:VWA domain-containing protein [Gammaproteobacteria bacterium]
MKRMTLKTFFTGLLIFILIPLGVAGGFAAYTHFFNASPQTGLLHCKAAPQILFTDERADYSITFRGSVLEPEQSVAKPLDIIFVVDVSISMSDSLPEMAEAARIVANELEHSYTEEVRFALISFHSDAAIELSWTKNTGDLYARLNALRAGGGTDGLETFPPINSLLGQSRAGALKVVIYYTDGEIYSNVERIIDAAEKLRKAGVQLFAITPPNASGQNMVLVTGDPERVLTPRDIGSDMVTQFRAVVDQVTGIYGYGAELTHAMDGRNFSTPVEAPWRVNESAGHLQLSPGYLPYRRDVTFQHPLIPHSVGLWRIGIKPPQLSFVDNQGEAQSLTCRQPRLLVLTWWFLLLAFLPALLWILYAIYKFFEKVINKREYTPPDIHSPTPPSPLPFPAVPIPQREPAIPALFIGLGGAGRNALYATQEALKASHLDAPGQPYRFIWLDTDVNESENKPEFEAWDAFAAEEIIAPQGIRQTEAYLRSSGQEDHLRWFNGRNYLDAGRERLNLSKGARGDRNLARRVLFRWLEKENLLAELEKACGELMQFNSADGTRQVVVFANRDGGAGSAWFVDIARVLRRILRTNQKDARNFIPEIIGIVCTPEHPGAPDRKNRQTLDLELETAQLSGAFPQRTVYVPGHPRLDMMDREAPFNWLFSVSGANLTASASQCAELSAVLVERQPRNTLLAHRKPGMAATRVNSVHVLPDMELRLVRLEAFLRMLGRDVLLDVTRDPAGRMAIEQPSEQRVNDLLARWIEREPRGTPWHNVLQAAHGTEAAALAAAAEEEKIPEMAWFRQAFAVSLGKQLWGFRDAKTGRWNREWMPGEALSVLHLLNERLSRLSKETGMNARCAAILKQVANVAEEAEKQLQSWIDALLPACEAAWLEKLQLEEKRARADTSQNKVFLGLKNDGKRTTRWTEQAMQRWVSSKDIVSALRERLFFSAQAEKDTIKIGLSLHVQRTRIFSSPQLVTDELRRYAHNIGRLVPILEVEGALMELESRPLKELARGMVDASCLSEQVLISMPTVDERENKPAKEALAAFRKAIVEPAGNAVPRDCFGDDHAAIRRLELQTEQAGHEVSDDLPFVQEAERIAETVRQKAMNKFQVELPAFPPALRIALAHPDAFRSFAGAYKSGRIIQCEDDTGALQWFFDVQGEFLTFGNKAPSLADAAANYVFYVKSHSDRFIAGKTPGGFEKLEEWRKTGLIADDDLFVLAAIDVYED